MVLIFFIIEILLRYFYSDPWYIVSFGKEDIKFNDDCVLSEKVREIDAKREGVVDTPLHEVDHFNDETCFVKYFREQINKLENKPNSLRILTLGCSFTYGSGVEDKNRTFPKVLEKRLNSLPPLDETSKVEVFNGGIPGSLTNWWVNVFDYLTNSLPVISYGNFEFMKGKFIPDIVVNVFFLRDGTLTSSMGSFFLPIYETIVRENNKSNLYKYSYFYRKFKDYFDQNKISTQYTEELHLSYFGDEYQTREWRRAKENLLAIKKNADSQSVKTALVIFPILIGLDENYLFKDICNELEQFGEKNGIPTFSLFEAFSGFEGPELWVSEYDQHPNEKAHAIAGDALSTFIYELAK